MLNAFGEISVVLLQVLSAYQNLSRCVKKVVGAGCLAPSDTTLFGLSSVHIHSQVHTMCSLSTSRVTNLLVHPGNRTSYLTKLVKLSARILALSATIHLPRRAFSYI